MLPNIFIDPRYSEILRREQELENLIYNILGFPLDSISTSANSRIGGRIDIRGRLPTEGIKFIKSGYYYHNKSIIHFTNIDAANSILENGTLRLYNLYYKNDRKEFLYVSELLNGFCKPTESFCYDIENETKEIRYNTFILSATTIKNIKDFWKKDYSMKGKGVGIELSFINNPDNWAGFYLSPVKYGQISKFIDLRNKLIELKEKHKNVDYKINLNQLIPFHKDAKWVDEHEIRLMTFFPQEFKLQTYIDTGNENVKCIKLPLLSNEFNNKTFPYHTIPFMKIEKIHLGPKMENNDIKKLKQIIKENYFYNISLL